MDPYTSSLTVKEHGKTEAIDFLTGLHLRLNANIPVPGQLRDEITAIVAQARATPKRSPDRYRAFPEGAFINTYAVHQIHDYLISESKMNEDEARKAFLCESWGRLPGIASGSPKRPEKHPFTKEVMGISAKEVFDKWSQGSRPLTAGNYPDMALRAPFKILFEAKYFDKGNRDAAARALVTGIYESFFYLGLPRGHDYDYEYACFLACDASEPGTLLSAWHEISESVRSACWRGANIFVMIIRNGYSPT